MNTIQTCRICKTEKPLESFSVNRHIKSGINTMCKQCGAEQTREYRVRTYVPPVPRVSKRQSVEAFKAKQKEWRENNKESINKRMSAWQKANLDKCRARTAKHRAKNPEAIKASYERSKERNPGWIAKRSADRRTRKMRAKPAWANDFFIAEIYDLARRRTKATGIKWEVDHIYPLKSDVICGLHVETNLRVIPAVLNRSKGNKIVEVQHG